MKTKLNIYFLNNILGLLLLFFGVFDTTRNYTHLPIAFGYVKDISIYLLILINLRRININNLWVTLVFIIILLASPVGFFYSGLEIKSFLVFYFKFLEVPLIFIIFLNFNRIFSYSINYYFKGYILCALLLAFINVFGYFVPNPIVSVSLANENMDPNLYKGRITVGQPPLAIFPVLFAYCYFLINCHKKRNIIVSIILLILIFLATSNTGIIAVIFCSIIIFILSKKKEKINMLCFLAVLLCIGLLSFNWLSSIFDTSMYVNKIISMLNGGSDSSLDLRFVHWQAGFENTENKLFGNGIFGYIRNGQKFDIENTYVLVFLCYGILGVIVMIYGMLKYLSSTYKIKNDKKKLKIYLFCVFVIYALHFITLDLFFCYMLYFPLGIYISMLNNNLPKYKNLNDINGV